MAMPMARLRRSGGTSRLTTPNTTGKVVPESPSPTSTPAASVNPAAPSAAAMNHSPAT